VDRREVARVVGTADADGIGERRERHDVVDLGSAVLAADVAAGLVSEEYRSGALLLAGA
jgi:dihydroxyacetone kinase DhaKLM complex PTS-EIIA-like component DhaM